MDFSIPHIFRKSPAAGFGTGSVPTLNPYEKTKGGSAMKMITAAAALATATSAPVWAGSIVEDWARAEAPKPVETQPVTVKAATTALLILDMQNNSCNADRRPRCVDAIGPTEDFLARARAAKMPVVYSNTSSASRDDIVAPLAPQDAEPGVKASVDKFYGTDLDKILKDAGVDTVIVCGTTSFGAVLFTATEAALRGYKVVQPVDCMPGSSLYEEQMTLWTIANGPGTRRAATVTTLGGITIE